MVALIILGVLVLIITVIMLIPVGVDVGYEQEKFHLSVKADGVLLQLIPKPPKKDGGKPKKEKKPKKKKEPKPEPEGEEEQKKKKKKLSFDFNKEELFELVKIALKAVKTFGRKLNVSRFVLRFTAAGDDPYNTAMLFGYVNAALDALAPLCARRFTVHDCDVRTDVDFTAADMKLDLGLAITIRIGQIVGVALAAAFGALKILLRNKLRLRREARELKKNGNPADGEAVGAEQNETIQKEVNQEEERMAANGN